MPNDVPAAAAPDSSPPAPFYITEFMITTRSTTPPSSVSQIRAPEKYQPAYGNDLPKLKKSLHIGGTLVTSLVAPESPLSVPPANQALAGSAHAPSSTQVVSPSPPPSRAQRDADLSLPKRLVVLPRCTQHPTQNVGVLLEQGAHT
ncbi:hypothetical protein R3P38DRAFT_3239118 [Favolaschia claudopus]|uniref:Uncharacterized protein n=1 Tax=Favolaschia claudopus TaxID=2862362 RepID=A0AAV9Z9G8_9AGAR